MYTRNGQPFDISVVQIIDDMQYPVGWFFNAANRAAAGVIDDNAPPPPENLDPLKDAKNEQINQWRGAANFSTFPFNGKLISCDTLSRSDIDGVANSITLLGSFPVGFPMAWKATDNSYIQLADIDDFKAMYAAMAAQGSANFARAQALKVQLAQAATAEEIAAIIW